MGKEWTRTCQECGNTQTDNEPNHGEELPVAYRQRACVKCKSESLDYGTFTYPSELDSYV